MTQDADPIDLYDPLLAAVSPRAGHRNWAGGYKVWPEKAEAGAADLRIMAIGNSTSLWPSAAWSLQLGQMLAARGYSVAVWNGAGKGNSSSQEAMRVLRDAPAIRPHLILALSGICDIGYLVNAKGLPFAHKYTRRVMYQARATGVVEDVVYGMPDPASPAEVWCRNHRLARAMADEIGARLVTFLQPVQGTGRYVPSPEERAAFEAKAPVVLKAADRPYAECLRDFYDGVRTILAADPARHAHVVDLTDAFADTAGAYRDHRHQTQAGVTHLARSILAIVEPMLPGLGLAPRVAAEQ